MVQACLIGLIASLGVFGDQLGSLYINRPIILAPLVGLVLGNLHQGLIIGASLELFFMGLSVLGLMFHRIRLSAVFWPLHLQFPWGRVSKRRLRWRCRSPWCHRQSVTSAMYLIP